MGNQGWNGPVTIEVTIKSGMTPTKLIRFYLETMTAIEEADRRELDAWVHSYTLRLCRLKTIAARLGVVLEPKAAPTAA